MPPHHPRCLSFAVVLLTGIGVSLGSLSAQDKNITVAATLDGHKDTVYAVAVSPDGKFIATACGDKTVRLFDAATGKEVRSYAGPQGHTKMVLTLAFSPDGRTLASGSEDNTLKLWDIPVSEPVRTLAQQQALYCVALSPDGTKLGCGLKDGGVKVFNVADSKELMHLPGHTQPVTRLSFSANGQILASASQDQTLRYWNIVNQQLIGVVGAHRGAVQQVALHPNGAAAYSVGEDGLLKFWTLPPVPSRALPGHAGDILTMALSADGSQVLTGGADKTVRGFTFANNAVNRQLTGPTASVTAVGMNPTSTLIAAGTQTGELHFWTAVDNKPLAQLPAHAGTLTALSFHPQGTQLLTGGDDGLLKTWNLPPLPAVVIEQSQVPALVLPSADGKKVLTAGADGIVRSWDVPKKAIERQFTGHTGPVTGLAVSPNGQLLISGGADGTLRVWNPVSAKENDRLGAHVGGFTLALHPAGTHLVSSGTDRIAKVWQLPIVPTKPLTHADQVTCVAVSGDGTKLATGCNDKQVRLWNLATGVKERDFPGLTLPISCVALSADAKWLAAGGVDKTVHIWNAVDGKTLHKRLFPSAIQALAVSPDNKYLVAGLADGSIRIIDIETGTGRQALAPHAGPVVSLVFTPKGEALLSASQDGSVQRWSLQEHKIIFRQENVAKVPRLTINKTGDLLAVADGNLIQMRDPNSGVLLPGRDITTPAPVTGVHFAPDGKRLVVGCGDAKAHVYSVDGTLLETLAHDGPVHAVVFADAKRVVTASADKQARLWTPAILWHRKTDTPAGRVLFSAKGEQVYVQRGGQLVLCNTADGTETLALKIHDKDFVGMALSSDGSKLATLDGDGVKVWGLAQAKPGVLDKTTPLHAFAVKAKLTSAAFNPAGTRLAVGVDDKEGGTILVFDLPANREVLRLPNHKKGITSVAFLTDNRTVVSGGDDLAIRLSDTGIVSLLDAHPGGVVGVQYHGSGTQAVSAGKDKTIKLWDLTKNTVLKTFGPVSAPIQAVTFNRDFTQVGAAAGKTVYVWNAADGKELATLAGPAEVLSLSFNFDKTRLATGGADKITRVWDLASGQELQFFAQSDPVRGVAFHNANAAVLSAAGSKQVAIDTITATRVLKGEGGSLQTLTLTPNGSHVVTVGSDKQVSLWNTANGLRERSFPPAEAAMSAVAVSKNNVLAAAASVDKQVHIYNFADGKLIKSVAVPAVVRSLTFSPNNLILAASCENGAVEAWNCVFTPGPTVPAEFLKPLQSFAHTGAATDLVFAADNSTLFSSGLDAKLQTWAVASDLPTKQFAHGNYVGSVAFHPGGTKVATGAADGKLRIFDLVKGVVLKDIAAHMAPNQTMIYSVAFHPKLDLAATAGFDGIVKLWDTNSGNLVRELRSFSCLFLDTPGHHDNVYALAFSPDGEYLATGSAGVERLIKIWKVSDGSWLRDLHNPKIKRAPGFEQSHPGNVYGLRYTSDGKYLISAGDAPQNKGALAIWEAASGKLLHAEELPLGSFYSLAVMSDNRTIVVGAGARGKTTKDVNKAYVLKLPLLK
jgi:WD40 repeat protein